MHGRYALSSAYSMLHDRFTLSSVYFMLRRPRGAGEISAFEILVFEASVSATAATIGEGC